MSAAGSSAARGAVIACEQVNLTVQQGEFLAVVGPSGCGKSTLLNMAAGLLSPSAGQVFYRGAPVRSPNTAGRLPDAARHAAALAHGGGQRGDRAGAAGRMAGGPPSHGACLARTRGPVRVREAYPAQLSGGMRRRVCLARTLAYEPETILMDEPFGALDAQLRLVMHDELLKLWAGTGKTIVFVTHDLAEALTLADRVAVFSARPGRIRAIETVDLPRPRDVFRVRFDPHFGELHDRLWSYLEASVRGDVRVN